jgi:sugar phosphate isomerase/epimerase
MLKLATKFVPTRDAFEIAHRAGFRNAELWLDASVLADWKPIVPVARDYPFEYVLHFPNRTDLSPATLEQCVELYRALDSRCLVIHQPMCDKYHKTLTDLDRGLRLAVENHALTPDGLRDWAESNPGLTLDIEHLWMLTFRGNPLPHMLEELRQLLSRFASKLRHVHLPGYVPGFEEHRPMYCSREMVFAALSLLADVEFEGLVVSETREDFQNPNELRMDVLLFDVWREQCQRVKDKSILATTSALQDSAST